jgi:hypothetical protein
MTFHRGTSAALTLLFLAACGQSEPPSGVSQGAAAIMASAESTPVDAEISDTAIGGDGLRARLQD